MTQRSIFNGGVHAERHIAEQDQVIRRLVAEVTKPKDKGGRPSKKRKSGEKKVQFETFELPAAKECSWPTTTRTLEKQTAWLHGATSVNMERALEAMRA